MLFKNSEEDNTINVIHKRWHLNSLISLWVNLPKKRKERVLSEIEYDYHQVAEYSKELANDNMIAVDTLEALSSMDIEYNNSQAINDIQVLLNIIKKLKVNS